MECYCEALVQELEENQKQMLGELQNLRIEHSTCVYAISSTKAQMETMSQDMNEQILRFSEDGHDLDSLDQELERRVITSEATIKKAHSHSLLRMSAACATWSLVVCRGLLLLLKLLLELNLKKFLRWTMIHLCKIGEILHLPQVLLMARKRPSQRKGQTGIQT